MTRYKNLLIVFAMAYAAVVHAQSLDDFSKRLTEFTLDNGLKFLVVERHEAPVVSLYTYADVGSVNEVKGITGMAHIFEHMAFKGTKTIGTKNLQAELDAMKREDEAFLKLKEERGKGAKSDPKKIEELEKKFEEAIEAAQQYVVSNEIGQAIDRAGGVGLNASTGYDATDYYYSLPSNKLELWFSLESDRFLNPVLREFYTEKEVVMEERRMSTDNSPDGRLDEEFLAVAFKAHPYGEPVVGHMSDLQTVTRAEAEQFFQKHYIPANLTIAIVGDVNPQKVRELAQTYFGRLPAKPKPEPMETVEPEQPGERRVKLDEESQPNINIGYHIPSIHDKDWPVFSVLSDVVGRGRASRLYTKLVKQQKIAISASGFAGYPDTKYPNLMMFYGAPTQGHTTAELEKSIYEEIAKIQSEPVSDDELKKAKTRARADLIRSLGSNTGIARLVAFYQAVTGDWRNLFRRIDQINSVTAADLQRVAKQYFTEKNRVVGVIHTLQ